MENALAIIPTQNSELGAAYCSIQATGNRADDAKVFNAINNPEYRIADFINKHIEVENFAVEIVELENEETGEVSRVPRVVLIDTDGAAYQATSIGMLTAIKNAVIVFGNAPWNPALEIEIKQKATRSGSMLTFTVVK